MTQISFSVSARTARLIGQENFTNAEGAIIELVKNGYDADAKLCLVIFDIPFPNIPEVLSIKEFDSLELEPPLKKGFHFENTIFKIKENLDQEILAELKSFFYKKNSIYIIDNGDGMDDITIENHWMTIGTGNKEKDYISQDGRVKTGAKGIGRFALDRLGALTRLWTRPKKGENGYKWIMDWQQFEAPGLILSDIKASLLSEENLSLDRIIRKKFSLLPFVNNFGQDIFEKGTLIQIKNLRDNWSQREIQNVYKSLEALIPPKELRIPFRVFQGDIQNPKSFGEVETAFFNEYDYKCFARYNSTDLTVTIDIERNELEMSTVKARFKHLFDDVVEPYDLKTLEEKEFTIKKTVNQILKWSKNKENEERLREVGDFDFTFYFIKNNISRKEDYPIKSFNSSERTSVLNRFGGIKIYRDSFRVRPYGDPGNDWLDLGRRASKSPAGPGQRIGDWRVGSNQVAGIINISRIHNEQIIDKSDRGALVENLTFTLFKNIITGIIHEFEYDRTKILNPFYLFNEEEKKRVEQERIRQEAIILAEKLYEARIVKEEKSNHFDNDPNFSQQKTNSNQKNTNSNTEQKEEFRKIIEDSFQQFRTDDEKDAEIAQVRNLASLGLILSSFAHELRGLKNNINEIPQLEAIFEKIASPELKSSYSYKDGKNIIELLKSDGEKIEHWVDYSLTAIKKDKRKRTNLNFNEYFLSLKKNWNKVLQERNIYLNTIEHKYNYNFRAFEIDMNTIFGNLISNSIDSFNNLSEIIAREITIDHKIEDNKIKILYSDNGTGLPDVFTNKEDIFLAFTTSKKDKNGMDIGTGLGMYLVKGVVDDNNGIIEVLDSKKGFKLKIEFPTRIK